MFGVSRPRCPKKREHPSLRKKVGVLGSRNMDDLELVFRTMERATIQLDDPIICVFAGYKRRIERKGEWAYTGIQELVEKWAVFNWYTVEYHHPSHKPSPICYLDRNSEFLSRIDYLVCFHDGEDPYTKVVYETASVMEIPARWILC